MESLLALLITRHIDIRFSSPLQCLWILFFVGIVRFFGDFLLACLLYLEHTVSRSRCCHCPAPPPLLPPPCCWVYNEITLAILCLFVFIGLETLARYYSTIAFVSTSFSPLRCACVMVVLLDNFPSLQRFYISKREMERKKKKGFSNQNFQTH